MRNVQCLRPHSPLFFLSNERIISRAVGGNSAQAAGTFAYRVRTLPQGHFYSGAAWKCTQQAKFENNGQTKREKKRVNVSNEGHGNAMDDTHREAENKRMWRHREACWAGAYGVNLEQRGAAVQRLPPEHTAKRAVVLVADFANNSVHAPAVQLLVRQHRQLERVLPRVPLHRLKSIVPVSSDALVDAE